MKGNKQLLKLPLLMMLIGIAACIIYVMYSNDDVVLEVQNLTKEENVLNIPINIGDEFILGFTSSMYRVPQEEHFFITKDHQLELHKVTFGNILAAHYYNPDITYTKDNKKGWFVEVNSKPQDNVTFFQGRISYWIKVGDSEKIFLDKYNVGWGDIVAIDVRV